MFPAAPPLGGGDAPRVLDVFWNSLNSTPGHPPLGAMTWQRREFGPGSNRSGVVSSQVQTAISGEAEMKKPRNGKPTKQNRQRSQDPFGAGSKRPGSEVRDLTEAIYAAIGSAIHDFATAACKRWGRSDPYDIVSEVFLRLHEALMNGRFGDVSLGTLSSEDSSLRLRTWLRRTAKYVMCEEYRVRHREIYDVPDVPWEPDESSLKASEADLGEALDRCSQSQRLVVTLRLSGLTYEEIAEELQISAGAARARYHRAVECLRGLLKHPL